MAAVRLEKAVALDGSDENRVLLAAAALRVQLRLPPADRDWSVVDKLLAAAKPNQAPATKLKAWKLSLLKAEELYRKTDGKTDREAGLKAALQELRNAERERRPPAWKT